jgi:hypothetical protein
MAIEIPPVLYKYQPYSTYALTNLANRQIWFARPASLNDPFDCAIPAHGDPSDEEYEKCFQRLGERARVFPGGSKDAKFREGTRKGIETGVSNQIRAMRNERGICCFSACNDSILMWAHYADGHKGFCLGFDTSVEEFWTKPPRPVKYLDSIPRVSPVNALQGDATELLDAMVTTKHTCWSYEQEWRIMHIQGDKLYGYPLGLLKSVHFGMAMPESHRIIIGRLLHGTGTKFYEMRRDPTRFAVNPQEVTFTPK